MADGDHLDYIRIRGLESGPSEMFQGAGGAACATATDAGADTTTALAQDWGELPEEARVEIQTYFAAVQEWWAEATSDRSLSKSRGLPMLRPVVPLVLATIGAATGPISLPVVATTLLADIGMRLVDGIMGEVAKLVVPDQLEDILEKALLSEDQSILKQALMLNNEALLKRAFLKDDKAILETALLYVEDEETKSVLNERLKDLAGVDVQVETNDIKITSLKGGVIEYV